MNILILGSSGQIGSHLSKYLRNEGFNIIEFDIEKRKEQDLRIPGVLNDILPNIDFVFFLAFDVGGSIYLNAYQNNYNFISNNIKIMVNTFDSLKKYNTKFVFASSQMSDLINSSYGVLKNIGEKYTLSLDQGKIIKLWNVYGIESDPKKFHVISDFIFMAKRGLIKMKTCGEENRQFLYAGDCSECLTIIMKSFDSISEKILDISNFEWNSIYEVAEIISANFNNCPFIPGIIKDDLQRSYLRDPDKAILKYWKPKTSLKKGIEIIIKEYEKNN